MENRLRDHWRQKDLDDKFQAKQKYIVVFVFFNHYLSKIALPFLTPTLVLLLLTT